MIGNVYLEMDHQPAVLWKESEHPSSLERGRIMRCRLSFHSTRNSTQDFLQHQSHSPDSSPLLFSSLSPALSPYPSIQLPSQRIYPITQMLQYLLAYLQHAQISPRNNICFRLHRSSLAFALIGPHLARIAASLALCSCWCSLGAWVHIWMNI
jgi:hypothetical protein